jgi:hypothetical protein
MYQRARGGLALRDGEVKMVRIVLLRLIAATLLVGGTMRLFAGKAMFKAFGIGPLWMDTPYSIYIYRVLGAFVILSGIPLLVVSSDPKKFRPILQAYAAGFTVIGLVMLVAGLTLGLPYRYYLPDPVYCLVVAVILWRSGR